MMRMRSVILNLMMAYSCVCTPILLGFAIITFLRPIKTARTNTQRTLYILLVVFFPLLLPLILVLISVSLLIQPAFLIIVVLLIPLAAVFLLLINTILPNVTNFFRRLTGGLAKRIFSFVMKLPMYPIEQVDASIDTLASYSWRLFVRNPIYQLIQRKETNWVMRWWGRREGRVPILLALARDPGLESSQRKAAITQLGKIASSERSRYLPAGDGISDSPQTATSVRLRELACDRAVFTTARLMAATTLLNHGFRSEARLALSSLAQDNKITDPRIRVRVAQGLKGLGPEYRAQAVTILLTIMADDSQRLSVRGEAAKIMTPLCDNEQDARKIDLILAQWSGDENTSPQARLQAARIFARLFQLHQNNPSGLAQAFQWDQRAAKVATDLAVIPYTAGSAKISVQALQILCNLGEIDALIKLGKDETLSYPIRSEAARILERLGLPDEAVVLWMDLAIEKPANPANEIVTPLQRIEAAAAAGQGIYANGREITERDKYYTIVSKEILQSVAQTTCLTEPWICLEAAAALRQLGWYEEAISFVMMLDKNHRNEPELSKVVGDAMRWRGL
jgi:hypothetical protein